jgi:hypothetical protein
MDIKLFGESKSSAPHPTPVPRCGTTWCSIVSPKTKYYKENLIVLTYLVKILKVKKNVFFI